MLDKLFVYGTLMQGYNNYRVIEPYGDYLGQARLAGFKMLDISGLFPAIIKSKKANNVIKSEVYHLRDTTSALVAMDKLEDHPNTYLRQIMTISMVDGQTVSSWVYVWQLKSDYQVITSGDYRTVRQVRQT